MLQIGRLLFRYQLVSVDFLIDIKSFRSQYGPGVDSASNRNEYQEYFLGTKVAGAYGRQPTTILCRCHEIWNLNFLEPSGPLQACNGTALSLHEIWDLNFLEPSGPLQTCNRTALPVTVYSAFRTFIKKECFIIT